MRCFGVRRGTPRRYKDRAGSALMGDGGGVYGDGGDGRGNLRENREDPAPTVGIAGRLWWGMPH